ncbi:MAG: alkyl hydroperoxide reductase, partial [Gemmatimonadota bacterium]
MRVQTFVALAVVAGLGAIALPASAQEVTYARDVAPIIQNKCQECHTENSIAPFTLDNYDQVVRRARMIRRAVDERVMPPWHINPTIGIQHFKNNRGLTPDERQTVLAWIDAGTPMGDPADLPAPREPVDYTQWQMADQFGEPDLVVTSEPYTLE